MASDTTTAPAPAAPEKAEAVEEYDSNPDEVKRCLVTHRREASDDEDVVEEYESDPDEVKHSLVMRRMEASDDKEKEDKEFER